MNTVHKANGVHIADRSRTSGSRNGRGIGVSGGRKLDPSGHHEFGHPIIPLVKTRVRLFRARRYGIALIIAGRHQPRLAENVSHVEGMIGFTTIQLPASRYMGE